MLHKLHKPARLYRSLSLHILVTFPFFPQNQPVVYYGRCTLLPSVYSTCTHDQLAFIVPCALGFIAPYQRLELYNPACPHKSLYSTHPTQSRMETPTINLFRFHLFNLEIKIYHGLFSSLGSKPTTTQFPVAPFLLLIMFTHCS